MPQKLWRSLQAQMCQLGADDNEDAAEPRLTHPFWLDGDEIGIYWETVARWIHRRVRRDSQRLKVPLLHVQAKDDCSNIPFSTMECDMRVSVTEHILTKSNMTLTGNMHGVFSLHIGMEVRLKRNVSLKQGLAQEAEGNIVDAVLTENTAPEIRSAWAAQVCFEEFVVDEVPAGVWVLMDDYIDNPNLHLATKLILDAGGGYINCTTGQRILSVDEEDRARRLLFLERWTSFPFKLKLRRRRIKLHARNCL